LKKRTSFLLILIFSVFIFLGTMDRTIPNATAAIQSHNWIGAAYEGTDAFLGSSVIAFKTGSTAKLVVQVYNDFRVGAPYNAVRPVNVSAVKVWFDWNQNYTSTECSQDYPFVVQPNMYHSFTITFNVTGTDVASNLVTHNYKIYVEHVQSILAGAKAVVGTWTTSGSNFAVYSTEQAYSMQVVQKYSISTPQFSLFGPSTARGFWTASQLEMVEGARLYATGDFTNAKTHYQNADSLSQQAIQSEENQGLTLNNFQSYGFLLMGIGLTLFGVGALVFGVRRRSS
jgi:hypothetical protein